MKTVYQNKSLGLEIIESNEPIIFQEAEYQGRKVKLGKVQRGGKKKFQVYVQRFGIYQILFLLKKYLTIY